MAKLKVERPNSQTNIKNKQKIIERKKFNYLQYQVNKTSSRSFFCSDQKQQQVVMKAIVVVISYLKTNLVFIMEQFLMKCFDECCLAPTEDDEDKMMMPINVRMSSRRTRKKQQH